MPTGGLPHGPPAEGGGRHHKAPDVPARAPSSPEGRGSPRRHPTVRPGPPAVKTRGRNQTLPNHPHPTPTTPHPHVHPPAHGTPPPHVHPPGKGTLPTNAHPTDQANPSNQPRRPNTLTATATATGAIAAGAIAAGAIATVAGAAAPPTLRYFGVPNNVGGRGRSGRGLTVDLGCRRRLRAGPFRDLTKVLPLTREDDGDRTNRLGARTG
ncbi:hypothetical protein GCM10010492_31260 [Saccharothrix mutabilis subsp. mutabilis]|uniref:Uncharacterized protein n=1 Tax=Saccharothrix mutabilis subsp. mutabilis TaxID=66855 RepID=A0ABN0TUE6_9PSEU